MRPRVLIVDDEPALRSALERVLRSLGFEGVAVGEANLAYEVLDGKDFDLVLLDIHMRQISGDALSLALIRRWPRLRGRIVFMTGDPIVREGWPDELAGCPVLPKPFSLDGLSSALWDTLRAAQASEGEKKAEGHA